MFLRKYIPKSEILCIGRCFVLENCIEKTVKMCYNVLNHLNNDSFNEKKKGDGWAK